LVDPLAGPKKRGQARGVALARSRSKGEAFDRDFDGPNRAVIGVDARASANLFDKSSHQPESMALVFGFGQETRAVIADGHGRDIAVGAARRHGD
jgi:hypothetical protein